MQYDGLVYCHYVPQSCTCSKPGLRKIEFNLPLLYKACPQLWMYNTEILLDHTVPLLTDLAT